MLGVRVGRAMAEDLRLALTSLRLVDKRLAILDDGETITIPLTGRPDQYVLKKYGAALVEGTFPERETRVDPIEKVREVADIPESLARFLPDKWEQFGSVVVLKLPHELDEHEAEVGRAYASALKATAVLREVGGISGGMRTPTTRRLFGSDTVAVHRENGIVFKFDAERLMFSSGNIEERMRMATVECDGETVVDMFAGIGYFTLPMAVYRRPRKVIACEINPVAHSYLVENIELNRVGGSVEPVLGDNRDLVGDGMADRVVMGYVRITHEFLPTAFRLLRDGGTVHYHETCPSELLPERPIKRLQAAAAGGRVEILRSKEIKTYAPGVSHVVVDARVFRRA